MALSKLMTKEITSLPESASVLDAAKFMADMNVGTVMVEDGAKPLGILTDRDIITKVLAQGRDPAQVKLRDVMAKPVTTISEELDILDATRQMSQSKVRRCAVVNAEGKLTGVIALDDILMCIGEEMQNIASILKAELGK